MCESWKPGKGTPHPDAVAIVAWARGDAKLDFKRKVVQSDLLNEGWIPADIPSFNPDTVSLRIRPVKMFTCAYTTHSTPKTGPGSLLHDEVPEHEVPFWDNKWAGIRARRSSWSEVWNPT
jgi:hypothetical protein